MRRYNRGSVFLIALAIVAGLVAVLVTLASTQRTALHAQMNRTETERARIATDAAVNRAMASLSIIVANSPTLTTDDWAVLGNKGNDRFLVGDESFRMEIIDASSRLNINTIPQSQLERLQLTPEQVAAILDFRSSGEAQPNGARDEYYNNLSQPYNAKERRLDTVDELLQVKDITPDILFNPQQINNGIVLQEGSLEDQPRLYDLLTVNSYSPLTTATGETKLNVNSASAQTISQRLGIPVAVVNNIKSQTRARLGDVLAAEGVTPQYYQAILDNLTTVTEPQAEGLINLNTVTEPVLNAIPELSSDMVTAILQRQESGGFTSLGQLTTVPGMNTLSVLQPTAGLFTTASNSFLVRVIGTAGGSSVAVEALLVIENNLPRISQIRDYPLNDPITRWGWQDEPTNDVVLLQGGSN